MRRVVVAVTEAPSGWTVEVTCNGALVAPPYPMGRAGGFPVPATVPQGDEPHVPLCRGDLDAISALLRRISDGRAEAHDVRDYGRWLFESLLAPVWPHVRGDVEIALRWPASSPLHRFVWEAMWDDVAPLAAHPHGVVAFTRLVPAPPPEPRTITGVPSVLFATSVRVSDAVIRPGAMFMGLLRGFDASGRCLARVVQGASPEVLEAKIARYRPDIVHLVAHGVLLGDGRGALMLAHENGGTREVDATRLVSALAAGGSLPTAVILSACESASVGEDSSLAAELVAAGVPIVSAMTGEVGESACRLYTRRFADAVHEGKPIAVASAHGRRAALVGNDSASRNIDWALPALFVAEGLDTSRPLVDPRRATRLVGWANELDLRREPVFIGRADVLDAVDEAVDASSDVSVVAVLTREPTSRLGGTRLLREIGWRVMRDGHVPVLLGPYQEASSPKTARELVFRLLVQLVAVTDKLGLPPFVPETLADELAPDSEAELRAGVAAAVPARARALIRKELKAFEARGDLDVDLARDLLAEDFAALAASAASLGEPFGDDTRVVVLCDDVHAWAAPDVSGSASSALGCLLHMLSSSGLGRPEWTVPVVFTGSTTQDSGGSLNTWRAKVQPGFLVLELAELAADEAVLGYQWVLLHPWTTRPPEDRELYGSIYTVGPAGRETWERTLSKVGGKPTNVDGRLYDAVDFTEGTHCTRGNDEQAMRLYADKYPEYEL